MAGHLSGDGSTARGRALRGTDPVRHLAGAGPRAKKAAPEAAAPEETDFQEYQPEKKMPSLLDHFARKAEPDTTGEVTLDPEDEDDGREEE